MFRILHFSLHRSVPSGVLNQLLSEVKAAKEIPDGVRWDTVVFSHDNSKYDIQKQISPVISNLGAKASFVKNYFNLRTSAYSWLREQAEQYDIVILRYRSGDIFLHQASKWFKNLYSLHHTKDIEEAKLGYNNGGIIEANLEKLLGPTIIKRVNGIIGVTQEIVDYEKSRININKPSICYPNGIHLPNYTMTNDERKGVLKLVFIASSVAPWYGLDRLLTSFLSTKEKFELHLVGPKKAEQYIDDSRFIFHGCQDGQYINDLLSKCDVGLSSFGLDRIGLNEASTLKVREYLARGLPVYAGHWDSGFPHDAYFFRKGPIVTEEILAFAEANRKVTREEIRNQAAPYIDKVILMKRLTEWLRETQGKLSV